MDQSANSTSVISTDPHGHASLRGRHAGPELPGGWLPRVDLAVMKLTIRLTLSNLPLKLCQEDYTGDVEVRFCLLLNEK